MISLAYGMGMLLAFTRERPRSALVAFADSVPNRREPPVAMAGSSA